jgi:hypothetical protein
MTDESDTTTRRAEVSVAGPSTEPAAAPPLLGWVSKVGVWAWSFVGFVAAAPIVAAAFQTARAISRYGGTRNITARMIPSEDPDYGSLGPAFPAWRRPRREPILQPPKPEIPPSPRILERMMDRDADWEAAD